MANVVINQWFNICSQSQSSVDIIHIMSFLGDTLDWSYCIMQEMSSGEMMILIQRRKKVSENT